MNKVLIVEDEAVIRTALRKLLERNKYEVAVAATVKEATKHSLDDFDLIISDLRLPGAPGTDLIKLASGTPVLIMTSYASLRSAVDSMRMGAVDYIAKPFDHDKMIAAVRQAIGTTEESTRSSKASAPPARQETSGMIGNSPVMKDIYSRIHKVAPTAATVLIHGETGTGKELVARAIHNESPRKNQPMICVNCAAIPDTLIESELFGHEKGAFTGAASMREGLVAAADGGTLFLDEIGELPLEAQARLLRVLQEGEVRPIGSVESRKVDVRLIAATHRNLGKLAQEGRFREDLYYRINVVQLCLPPLRERGADIVALAEFLLRRYSEQFNKPGLRLSAGAVQAISRYPWPGNVREMENAIQRAVILCEEGEIHYELLSLDGDYILMDQEDEDNDAAPEESDRKVRRHGLDPAEDLSLEDYFQRFVLEHQDSMSETELARKLGVSRKCLWERRQRLGIPRKKSAAKAG
ncbi:sigma-54-dependent transcriptional regulator [Gilvimarinus sp. F26214L]|uniref:sigma-54-dependent transcriptional regulator n=1 Tax=Gilvimarinus sp. DZF01 TaxID=3461371 RepID=UPI004045B5BD